MKTTTLMIAFVVLFGYTAQPRISFAQCGDAPKLTIQTDSVTVQVKPSIYHGACRNIATDGFIPYRAAHRACSTLAYGQ
jgi:hypothetical protein